MLFADSNKELLTKYYLENKYSIDEIAEIMNTNKMRISRALRYLKIEIRTKSEACKNAVTNGKMKSPTKGRPRTQAEKVKISQRLTNVWAGYSKERLEEEAKIRMERWHNLSEAKRNSILAKAQAGRNYASKNGSKLEKITHDYLIGKGYNAWHHANCLINEKLQVDIWLPTLKIAIEIDGPTHVIPIYGEERLNSQIKADMEKNGLLLSKGVNVIRVRYLRDKINTSAVDSMLQTINGLILNMHNKPAPAVYIIEVD